MVKIVGTLILLTISCGSARADAIDGNWCHTDGRRFTIRGADIVTPGGKTMQGNYERHYFSYVVPTPEPHAGQTIVMTLLGENDISLKVGNAGEERWVRCAPSISRVRFMESCVARVRS